MSDRNRNVFHPSTMLYRVLAVSALGAFLLTRPEPSEMTR